MLGDHHDHYCQVCGTEMKVKEENGIGRGYCSKCNKKEGSNV